MKYTVLGDRHNHKATLLVEDNGRKWIHKPRSAATEIAFKAFLSELEEEGLLFIPGTVNIISSSEKEHDVEIVDQVAAGNEAEVHLFYKRFGSLLFFSYLFSSNDLHFENIIAHSEYPVIVDYETLLTGDTGRQDDFSRYSLSNTVIKSHLLPNWNRYNNQDVDLGGLTGNGKNRLLFGGKPTSPYHYKMDIIEGFESAYNFCQKRQDKVQISLHLFDSCRFREILRPTQIYQALIELSKKRKANEREPYLRNLLSRAYKKDVDPNRSVKTARVLDEEINAVLQEEIPLFWTHGNGCHLCCREEILQEDFFKLSPVDNAIFKLHNLSDQDCRDQARIIAQSLDAITPLKQASCNLINQKEEDLCNLIYNRLESHSIGQLASGWMRLGRGGRDELSLQSQGFGLYNGLLGTLCCYAAIYYKTGRKEVFDRLLNYYESYRKIAVPEKMSIDDFSAGLNEGAGGHIKALCHISELTGLAVFKQDAEKIIESINILEEWPDGNLDVLNGYAGLAISLPEISKSKAVRFGKKLSRILLKYEPVLTGMGHGAGGIALALGILGKILDTDCFDKKVIDLLNWENDRYDLTHHNWFDLRKPDRKAFMLGWCSGAPGIGMSRNRLMEITDNQQIYNICREDVDSWLLPT